MAQTQHNLLLSLKAAVEAEDLDLVGRTAAQILKLDAKDKDALHCAVVALIQQSKFAEAVSLLEQHPSNLDNVLEKAYALYRLFREDECIAVVDSIPESQRSEELNLVRAQAAYRREDAKAMSTMMETFLQDGTGDPLEVKVNLVASYVIQGERAKAIALARTVEREYELLFNLACSATEAGNLGEALALIERAIQCCRASLEEEEADEKDIANSCAVLEVQRGYILQRQGRQNDALQIYQDVLQGQPSDEAVVAVASNNIISLRRGDEKLQDSLRKSQRASSVPAHKLPARQRQSILFNRCLVLLLSKQPDKAREAHRGKRI